MSRLETPGSTMIGMKYKMWKYKGKKFSFKVNYLDDVLNILRFKKRTFKDFKDLFNIDRERKAKKLAKDIFTDFLKTLSTDLIENNNIFVLPERNMGYVKISNTANPKRYDYTYNVNTEGKIFTPRIKLDKRIHERNKKHYKVRFNQLLRQRMFELINDGHKYQ